jgi:hypothetical protein
MDFIRGASRNQVILFPETVGDYIIETTRTSQLRCKRSCIQ